MRRAYTLVEVLVASAILVTGLVPVLSLMTTSSTQTVKARDRTTAVVLAAAVAEEMRMRRPLARADVLPAKPINQLTYLQPLVDAYKATQPGDVQAALDRNLSNFQVSVQVAGPNPATPLHVEITWTEAGQPRNYVLEGTLGGP